MKAPIAMLATTLLMSGTAVAQSLDIPEEVPEMQLETIEPSSESSQPVHISPTAESKILVEPNFDLAPVHNEALGESSPLYYDNETPAPGLSITIPTD